MQHFYRGFTQVQLIATVVQAGLVELVPPEFVFRLEQMHLGVGMIQHALDAIDVIVMTVGKQNIGDFQI